MREISIIIFIYRKLGSVGPVQQKFKLHSLYKKCLYFNDSNFLCYMKLFIKWFSQAIRLVKSGRQFVHKIL